MLLLDGTDSVFPQALLDLLVPEAGAIYVMDRAYNRLSTPVRAGPSRCLLS